MKTSEGNGWQSTGNSRISISLNEIVALDNDKNDVEILKMYRIGVVVDNAILDVKDIADSVTLSNDEDGGAKWLDIISMKMACGSKVTLFLW